MMTTTTDEPETSKRKRLHMRSIRRGIKEMDLILTAYSTQHLADLDAAGLDLYDAFLAEYDHDLYGWITGQDTAPEHYAPIMSQIMAIANGITRPT
jgi:antitoxin CptB